ncbi:FHA domain/BRCA1 C Terminus (BRCT) domain/twin BRCT domain containing protein [Novymonas esmeraldas]|uniref:FHA domain/BRCA1 C Terminus (BRCT) domain/twin BRCT domain containing protein n=1 Tax=Novymonas esmeraldas TaxID=1808958 RepID=A0AAW0ETT3_9TRYP
MSVAAYALVTQEKTHPLQVGKNVVGRSSVPVEGVSFINLESPQAAISRMQAFLDIGANGDAWISDCNSTNGTLLSIRPGPGIRLEANRYYQLSPGCRIVFGDVECTLEALSAAPSTPQAARRTPPSRPSRKTEPLGTTARAEAQQQQQQQQRHSATRRSDLPYLDENGSPSLEPGTSGDVAAPTRKAARRGGARAASGRAASAAKRTKAETPASPSAPPSPPPSIAAPHVCLSGMDGEERAAVTKRVRELKGRVVDDITKANLLVVATPPVRTPKFIIAVARGIPVVSVQYMCSEKAELADVRKNIVGLKMDQHTYTAAALEKVIYRADASPLLLGVVVNVAALSSKTKAVAAEIITSSGGEVVRAKKGGGVALTDDQLDHLYDSILRGTVHDTWPRAAA